MLLHPSCCCGPRSEQPGSPSPAVVGICPCEKQLLLAPSSFGAHWQPGESETAIPAFSSPSFQDLIFTVIDSDSLTSRSCLILLIGGVSALNFSHLPPPCHDYTGAMLPPIFLSFEGIPSPCSPSYSLTDSWPCEMGSMGTGRCYLREWALKDSRSLNTLIIFFFF